MSFVLSTTSKLQENLFMLAQVAMGDTGAEGFAYFRRSGERSKLERFESLGTTISEAMISEEARARENSPVVISYPLRLRSATDGALAFAFSSRTKLDAGQARLNRHAMAIGRLWAAQAFSQNYFGTLQRIVELETQLMNSKISSVVRGALSGGPRPESGDAIIRHVETVLRPSNTVHSLDQILQELVVEVEERHWIDQAKQSLHDAHGMPEWEAHSHLRKLHRQSRRPLVEIARQLVQECGRENQTENGG